MNPKALVMKPINVQDEKLNYIHAWFNDLDRAISTN